MMPVLIQPTHQVEERNLHLLALSLIKGLGPITIKNLIAYCGSPEEVLSASPARLKRAPGVGDKTAALLKSADHLSRAEQEVAYCQKQGIRILSYMDTGYPALLRQTFDAPLVIFAKGPLDFNAVNNVGIVGTRKATDYGKEMAEHFAATFARNGINVVSGLAYGIDIHAHRATVKEGGITTAVLGHGLDMIYPFAHRKKADEILERGALVTEYLTGSQPDASNFPARNRIISGMCKAVVVIEAAESGGALITAQFANEHNREVYAVPGRVNDPYSKGCNYLIRNNMAHLATSPEDVLEDLGLALRQDMSQNQLEIEFAQPLEPLTREEEQVLNFLGRNEALVDQISVNTGLPMATLNPLLISLEFKDLIRQMPGKRYKRI